MKFKSVNIKISILIFFICCLLSNSASFCQVKTNFELFTRLVDSSAVIINKNIPVAQKNLFIKYNTNDFYSVFRNRIIFDFSKLGKTVTNSSSEIVNYSIEEAKVNYGEMSKDGLFGGYYLQRTLKLKGNFSVENNSAIAGEFNLSLIDTVAVNDITAIENPVYPFTQGEVPSEPFFSSLFAPVVAIGSAALAVILFFTVRSK